LVDNNFVYPYSNDHGLVI